MISIKQFGLQRSGSNAVKALLEINFAQVHVLANYAGNKHEPASWSTMAERVAADDPAAFGLTADAAAQIAAQIAQRTLPVVITIKEPVSWVNSYYRYQRKKVLVNHPTAVFPFDEAFCRKVLPRWETNVLSWIALHDRHPRSLLFLHEEVIAGFDRQLELIRERFGLPVSERYPVGQLAGYARRGIETQHGEELINARMAFDREYHLGGRWQDDIPAELRGLLYDYREAVLRRHPRLGELLTRGGTAGTELAA